MSKINFLRGYLQKCNGLLHEVHDRDKIPMATLWLDSVWALLRYGCTITHYTHGGFYKLRDFERKKVVTFRRFKQLQKLNDPKFIPFLRDKDKFNVHFAQFVHRKWLKMSSTTLEKFEDFCQRHDKIVIKPLDGMEGRGVHILSVSSVDSLEILYDKLRKQNVLIEEVVKQHPQMVFGNKSVNTIRVMSVMDKNSGEVHVYRCDLRAGVGDSAVDNFNNGGCAYQIDITTGRVCSLGKFYNRAWGGVIFHPGTEICMLGYPIPNWSQVIDGCKRAHKLLPQCRLIAWDVAITDEGIELIEGNHDGDYDLLEFFGDHGYWPLLKRYL